MTRHAEGWVRLFFRVRDPKTSYRRLCDQYVRVARTSDGWQFVVGRCASSRLYLRPGGKRFKCPRGPAVRRSRRKRWTMWRRNVTKKSAPARCSLHIDDLLCKGVLTPGEPRNGNLLVPVGDVTVRFRYSSDLSDPNRARLWLYFKIFAANEWRHVSQEVQLAGGAGQWWFREDDRIGVELVLRNGRFHLPERARRPSKPLRNWPQQENPERAPQTAGNARVIAVRQSSAVRKTAGAPARKRWMLSKISRAKKAVARVVARPRARNERKPHIFARARVAAQKQIVKPWHFVTDLGHFLTDFVKRLMGDLGKQTARLANSWADAYRNRRRGKTT